MEISPPPSVPFDQPGLHLLVGRPATGKTRWVSRLVGEACGVGRHVRFLSLETPADRLRCGGLPAGVVDDRAGRSLDEVLAVLRELRRGGLLVIDYLQLLHFDGEDTREGLQRAGLAARKRAAAESGVTVVITWQLAREFEEPERLNSVPAWCAMADSAVRLPVAA